MGKFKTVKTEGKVVSFSGKLRLLESNGLRQKVELLLLNGKKNRNNWVYQNLEAHTRLFAQTPILCAYVGSKVGDGHNFDEVHNADGSITASFMSATAERIVGYIQNEEDISIVEVDGIQWIKAIGYLWTWYAAELSAKVKEQGLDGMDVSIETLIEEMHSVDGTEVFTKWVPLGTTILGDDVDPAVAGANIRALSAIGQDRVREITLRVASINDSADTTSAKNKNKGVKKAMKIKELAQHFEGYTVLAVDGENVALLSATGAPYLCTAKKDGESIVCGVKEEIGAVASFIGANSKLDIPVETITDALLTKNSALEEELAKANQLREAAETALASMQKAESARRKDAVRNSIKARLTEIIKNSEVKIDESVCDELLTDEKIDEYACMEDKDGKFIGDTRACKDVDALCMDAIIAHNSTVKQHRFAFDMVHSNSAQSEDEDGIYASVQRTINQ